MCVRHDLPIAFIDHPLLLTPYAQGASVCRIYNEIYLNQVERLKRLEGEGRFVDAIWVYEKKYRLDYLVRVRNKVSDADYWKLLAAAWTSTDIVYLRIHTWRVLFLSYRPEREALMSIEERKTLRSLPDEVTIYRGGTSDGLSWSLSRDVAERFAKRGAFTEVHTQKVPKKDLIAYFGDRGEDEVVLIK